MTARSNRSASPSNGAMTVPPVPTPRSQQRQKVLELMKKPQKRSKYRAVRCEVDGIVFDSRKEARRYSELRRLEKAGLIEKLITQPCYVLAAPTGWRGDGTFAGWTEIGTYRPDFEYLDVSTREIVTEDVKGFRTPVYRWKKKHVEAQYGISIREL